MPALSKRKLSVQRPPPPSRNLLRDELERRRRFFLNALDRQTRETLADEALGERFAEASKTLADSFGEQIVDQAEKLLLEADRDLLRELRR